TKRLILSGLIMRIKFLIMKSTKLLSWLQSAKGTVDQERARTEEDECGQGAGANSGGASEGPSEAPRAAASKNKRHKPVRRYDGREEEPRPQCVIFGDVLSNECMKPSHLKRHLTTKHRELNDKPVEFFLRKCDELKRSKSTIQPFGTPIAKAQEASYRASLRIARAGKPHTIGEQLCLPLAKEMTRIMCGEKAARELNLVPLSNDTMSRRIKDMAGDVKNTLIECIKNSRYFAIQLDETTDVADLANLLVYVRYEYDGAAQEDFMFCQSLETRTTAEHIFQVLNAFIQENRLDWKKCVGVCIDGSRAMTGRNSGVSVRIREVAPEMRWTHCSIHREVLKSVLDSAVKTVNFIKARPMNACLFHVLCEEMGSEHVQLLLHTEVRWLSRGKVLSRLFELHREVQMFLQDTNFPLSDIFADAVWLSRLAYVSDIFSRLNKLNLGLQGLSINVFDVQDKINALLKKLELFEIKVKTGDVSAFPALESFLSDNDLMLDDGVRENIAAHLTSLRQQFHNYFPVMPEAQASSWMRNPFNIDTSHLSCDETLKASFRKHTLLDFWMKQYSEYPVLSDKAVRFLLPFATTYLCEKGFSSLVVIKTKYRSRVDAEPNLRLKLTSIDPDIAGLCSQRHAPPSH
uniref:Uncharacterized protein n=1 Tax=Seriola dumerili TaxID=41447 RepID=A0A3B4TIW1_SERDU